MNQFPRPPGNDTPATSWLSRLLAAAQRLRPGVSSTMRSYQGPHGLVHEIQDSVIPPAIPFEWFGPYSEAVGYTWNAWVKVSTSKDYTDGSGTVYKSLPGIYFCVSPVPPKLDLTLFSDPFLRQFYTTNRQIDGIVYAPVVGMTETLAHQTTDGKGRYWEPISIICP